MSKPAAKVPEAPPTKAVSAAFTAVPAPFNKSKGLVSKRDPSREDARWTGMHVQWVAPKASTSMRACMKRPFKGASALTYKATSTEASVHGAFVCKAPLCWNCGPYKTGRFAEKLKRALIENESRKGTSTFLTLTIQSGNGRTIEEQRILLSSAYRLFAKEVSRQCKIKGLQSGIAYSYDLTVNVAEGFSTHLHKHLIWFCSGDAGLTEDELFDIWSRSVKKSSYEGYFVSRKAFYAKKVEANEAQQVSKYVSKFIKSALELANGAGKKCGFRHLVMLAADNPKAFSVYNEIVASFYGLHYSSLGKFASSLAGGDEEDGEQVQETGGEGSDNQEEVLVVTVPAAVHSILCDHDAIVPFLKLLKMHAENRILASLFVASWDDVLRLIDVEALNYPQLVLLLRQVMHTHLGFVF